MYNSNKFSWSELTSNTKTGKTSASSTVGIFISLIGGICFLIGSLTKNTEVITNSVLMTTMGCTLCGYHKYQDGKETSELPDNTEETPKDDKEN